ncbi:GNAT family N-acetyltransferase [Paracoccus aurantiacus]|uniref:GNAT family N-acetyltransferase n=1 Tax=Paracoccus aurantiacus TaxID=2599412 RepID=A0A5C6S3J7_9RHOB|nr:GNAT family protein [Paracoccus aurantiacus]TXB69069.1 GNAT family N-acetyltransferase [Paracoccus aurantiacus]
MTDANDRRPIGPVVENWQPPSPPGPDAIDGRYVRLERLDPAHHAAPVFEVTRDDAALWDYMSNGPFADAAAMRVAMEAASLSDVVFYVMQAADTGDTLGYASFMRIDAANGVLEIGNVVIAPAAQRSRAASEGLMAMIAWAFGAGYRRVEWKCNALNAPSRRAARRYGFAFEGMFRDHMIVKGRSRDTAWFAMTADDWAELSTAYDTWLLPQNFDGDRQITSLSSLTAPVVLRAEKMLSALVRLP